MKISEIIRYYRKRENLTQEQVANYLNISAPAVNKWENGISYPDITLLPSLAHVLKIDVNTLLGFNKSLTEIEIKKITREIGEIISKEGFKRGFERSCAFIKEYPNCDELAIGIVTVLRIYLLEFNIEEKYEYEIKIIEWLKFLVLSSKEKIASMAKLDLSAIYIEKKEYEKAQEILDKIPENYVDKKVQQALLFENRGEYDKAYGIYESKLWKSSHEILAALSFIINLLYKENKFNEAEEYVEFSKKVIELFDFGEYYKYQLDLSLAKEKYDKEKAIEIIIKLVSEANSMNNTMKSKLYSHMKFNLNSSISKDKYEKMVKEAIKKDKNLDFIKNDYRIKSLLI
ncbi:helix-turn-helix domain-containing protein [Clostridium perfringens]|uniref:helix-turn-helix domain-containing protein n=1 Tax=Clostridium perfringens TaxID=1502 RepID=UPI003AFF769C